MTSRMFDALTVRQVLGGAAFLIFTACGGIAIYEDGAGGTGGGTTGSSATGSGSTKCVSGKCGDSCVRCEGSDCKAGRCDKSLDCVVVSSPPTCN